MRRLRELVFWELSDQRLTTVVLVDLNIQSANRNTLGKFDRFALVYRQVREIITKVLP